MFKTFIIAIFALLASTFTLSGFANTCPNEFNEINFSGKVQLSEQEKYYELYIPQKDGSTINGIKLWGGFIYLGQDRFTSTPTVSEFANELKKNGLKLTGDVVGGDYISCRYIDQKSDATPEQRSTIYFTKN